MEKVPKKRYPILYDTNDICYTIYIGCYLTKVELVFCTEQVTV